ncbi:MAG: histidine phosphatase family protein [Phycisphaerales bacterium]|nr:histidine phosphatase family protein [Phycisphaerales bacterium]
MLAYLVRHAESLSNIRQTDRLNEGLSDLGKRQIDALTDRLSAANVAAIYSSPFERCIASATPLATRLSLPIRIRPELCEFHQLPEGSERSHELETIEVIASRHSIARPCEDYNGQFLWAPTDEPFDRLLARTRRFQAYLKERWSDGKSVAVFSHGSPIARLIDAWLTDVAGPSFRFIIDNAAVSAVRHHAGVSSLVCLNDVSHLSGLPAPKAGNYSDDRTIKAVPPSAYW